MYSYNPDIRKFVVFVVVNNWFIIIKRLFQEFLNTEARSKCRNSYKIQNQDMVTCKCTSSSRCGKLFAGIVSV